MFSFLVQSMKFKRVLQVSPIVIALAFLMAGVLQGRMQIIPLEIIAFFGRFHAVSSEGFMHLFSIPVWQHQGVLYTDLYAYDIVASYHGGLAMLAAVIASIVIALFRRYRVVASLCLLAGSVVTVMFLNIARITLLVLFGPAPDSIEMQSLLADSEVILAILFIVCFGLNVLLVESAILIRSERLDPIPGTETGALSELPPFWHQVMRRYRNVYILLPVMIVLALIAFRNRPSRRLTILSVLATNMSQQGNHTPALLLAGRIASQRPDDVSWQIQMARMQLLAGRPEEALETIERVYRYQDQAGITVYDHELGLLKAYGQVLLEDWLGARETIRLLQSDVDTDPIWSLIFLELALLMQEEDVVHAYASQAAGMYPLRSRLVPALPLLAGSGRWRVLLEATQGFPNDEISFPVRCMQMLSHFQLEERGLAAEVVHLGLQQESADADLIFPCLILAYFDPTEWEPRFATLLRRITQTTDRADDLLRVIDAAFSMHRADLGWGAYVKLQEGGFLPVYAKLVEALYADTWFTIRSHSLGFPADSPADVLDVFPLLLIGKHIPFYRAAVEHIPHLDQGLAYADDFMRWKQTARMAAVNEIETLPLAVLQSDPYLRLYFAVLLEQEGARRKAYQQYKALSKEGSSLRALAEYNCVRLDMFASRDWEAYRGQMGILGEADALPPQLVMGVSDLSSIPDVDHAWQSAYRIPLLLQLISLQWNNHIYMGALSTAREAVRSFPHDPLLRTAYADILMQLGFWGNGLHVLEHTTKNRVPVTDLLEAEALAATGRTAGLAMYRRQRLLPPDPTIRNITSPERLVPAENVLLRREPANLADIAPVPANPLFPLYEATRQDPDSAPDFASWLSLAKTRLEQAEAMHVLMSLLYQQGRDHVAGRAARMAVVANPREPVLWLAYLRSLAPIRVASEIQVARRYCPDDTDLWLLALVLSCHPETESIAEAELTGLIEEVRQAPNRFPVDTLVRGADFLWRVEKYPEAMVLIENYHGRERGLLAAHLLGLTAAEMSGDRIRALEHSEAAIAATEQAAPELFARYVKTQVTYRELTGDRSTLHALRQLRFAEPDNAFWAELLGYVRYQRGGGEVIEAGLDMQDAIASGSTNRVAFLIAADGFQRVNRFADAAAVLRQGLEVHPDDIVLLNNLAYVLAMTPDTIADAKALQAKLEPYLAGNPEIRDTWAFVLLRNGELDAARRYLAENIRELPPDSATWFRSQVNLAEVIWLQGQGEVALSMLEQLMRGARNIPDGDVLLANRLLVRIYASR
jgi:predicted Zn-dependent protease